MQIVDKITAVLDAMVTANVIKSRIYQNAGKANVQIDFEQTPAAVFYCATKWAIDLRLGVVRENATVGIGFVKRQSELDFDGSDNEDLIDDCKEIAVDFLKRLKASGGLTITSDKIECTSVYDEYDTNVTGVWVSFDVRDDGGECLSN